MARGMCQLEVTTIRELKLFCRAQRLASRALPNVLSAERSRSIQQVKYLEYSGVILAISRELVARCTPVIRSRLPRSVANSSIASGMRAAAPVRTTIPSALVSSVTSSLEICRTNQTNPTASTIIAVIAVAIVRKPIHRARPANMSVDHFKGVVDSLSRGQGSHPRDECDLSKHSSVSDKANRK